MAMLKLTAHFFIDSDNNPEDVATTFNAGAEHAMAGFPDGSIEHVAVENIQLATDEELDEHGLREE
jgi:hypothetical protein